MVHRVELFPNVPFEMKQWIMNHLPRLKSMIPLAGWKQKNITYYMDDIMEEVDAIGIRSLINKRALDIRKHVRDEFLDIRQDIREEGLNERQEFRDRNKD